MFSIERVEISINHITLILDISGQPLNMAVVNLIEILYDFPELNTDMAP
jgi:hypothetical protein